MPKSLPIYLHTHRKRWGLTQRELAFLLRIHPNNLSKFEQLEEHPPAAVLVGAEIIFGPTPRDVFPAFYEEVEAKVMRQAAILFERIEGRTDQKTSEKRRLLLDMIERASPLDDREV